MLHLEIRPYCRPFLTPLQTSHGRWENREGLILRFEDEVGGVSFGEVAPIPWFGTETMDQVWAFCDRFPRHFSPAQLADIPDTLPACQFGFGVARTPVADAWPKQFLSGASEKPGFYPPTDICALLPAGAAALHHWQKLWQQGHHTFKWKIGVAPVEEELPMFQKLVEALPAEAMLRLDANGGLRPEVAVLWLSACDAVSQKIEFVEQPLSPDLMLEWLPQIQGRFETEIALDESVATVQQLQRVFRQVGDQVVYVVKPAIAGCPWRLLDFCVQHRLDVVLSSALETPVGRNIVFELAHRLWTAGVPRRALGFGVGHWFADDWETLSEETLWAQI